MDNFTFTLDNREVELTKVELSIIVAWAVADAYLDLKFTCDEAFIMLTEMDGDVEVVIHDLRPQVSILHKLLGNDVDAAEKWLDELKCNLQQKQHVL